MKHILKAAHPSSHPYLCVTAKIVASVSDNFFKFCGYSANEIINRDIGDVLVILLRLSLSKYEQLQLNGTTDCFLFAKSLEAREVTVSLLQGQHGAETVYIIKEKPNSRLEAKLIFVKQVFDDNVKGAAVYSVPDLILLKANQKYLDACDAPFNRMENSIGRNVWEFITGFSGSPAEKTWNTILVSQESNNIKDFKFEGFKTGACYLDNSETPIFENGKMKYIFEVTEDVTERVLVRKQLDEQSEQLMHKNSQLNQQNAWLTIHANLLDLSNEAIFACDLEGGIFYWNRGAEELYGYSRQEVVGCFSHDLLKTVYPIDVGSIKEILAKGKVWNGEVEHTTKDGRKLVIETHKQVIDGESGQLILLETTRDITERSKAEMQYRILFESMHFGVVYQDFDGTIISMNPAAERILGKSPAEFLGESSVSVEYDSIREDGSPFPGLEHPAMVALQTGMEMKNVIMGVYNPREKAHRWIEINSVPVFQNGDIKPSQVYSVFNDITERRKVEIALQKSEQHHRLAAVGAALGTYIYDFSTCEDDWSPELYAIWGLKPGERGELDDDSLYNAMHPDDRQTFLEKRAAANDPKGSGVFDVDFRVIRPDGSIRWLHVRGLTTFIGDGENRHAIFAAGTAMDITENKILEQDLLNALKLAETNRLILETVIQQMPAGIILTDATGSQAKNNAAMNAIWRRNMTPEENIRSHAYIAYHPDGTEYKPEEWPLTKALMQDELVIGEEMAFLRGDGTKGTLLCSASAIKDRSGATIAGVVIDLDITELRQAQDDVLLLRDLALNAEKEKSETLQKAIEMKNEFLLTITHEFKTPLSVINSALQTMEMTCAKDITDRIRKYHNIIRQNSNRQLKLVNNLLDVTRMDAGSLKTKKRNIDIVTQTQMLVDSITVFTEQKDLKLFFNSTMQSKIVGIDEEKYERILLNLLSNAVKFTPAGQSIAVNLSNRKVHGRKMVCVQVRDTGIGIPEDKKETVFEKFGQVGSTRTRQAEGSGIGLHLVKMLVELLGGEIKLDSKLGVGSTFTVLLPDEIINEEEQTKQVYQTLFDERLIQATAIEFSDFYIS